MDVCNWKTPPAHCTKVVYFFDQVEFDYEVSNGKVSGKGLYTFLPENDKYEGEWKAGQMHGEGEYRWMNGARYEGKWANGKMHGEGRLTSAKGTFMGEWKSGKMHGEWK